MMNICITGGNGFLGSNIISACKLNNWNTIVHPGRNFGDLTNEEHVFEFANSLPELDCLICCAGGKEEDGNLSIFQKMINNNLITTYLCCKYFVPKIKKQSTIITIGSADGCFGQTDGSFYSSAKAALHIYSRCLAKQLLLKQISVNCLALGTLTNENINCVVKTVIGFCSYSSINGQVIRIDGGHHTFYC